MRSFRIIAAPFFLLLFMASCRHQKPHATSSIHFTALSAGSTGITFNNTITENDSVNLIANEYTYMGSGVGVGDFNNDGLADIFFGASQASCRLYINKGNLQFEDLTEKAGVSTGTWITGISVVDINNDGYDDLYLCVSGSTVPAMRRNHLFINNRNLTFTDEAAEYGLADTGYSTQAVFLDYDKDGDLDMYLLNHVLYQLNANTIVKPDFSGNSPANDRLYRNEGQGERGHPVYKDVTLVAGIREPGYGLGVAVSDFNNDSWPDIYVSNDYIANDVLWINNRDGTFSNRISTSVRHTSYSGMGVDAADINNDKLPDIATMDMLPEGNVRKKMMFSFMSNERFELERRSGYEPSFMRNMLQLNNGTRPLQDTLQPFFSEIGQLANLHQTDWSWSVLLADFDNDGWKDAHITNGMGKDMLNNDYIYYRNDFATTGKFASVAERNRIVVEKLSAYGAVELNNYCFRNNGNLTFSDVSAPAGINEPSVSNGCAYADLDNDGDLDLVVNNINQSAFVYRNDALGNAADPARNYLTITLAGDPVNRAGVGARVTLFSGGMVQFLEQYPVRGYSSTVDKRLHFGLGKETSADSLEVVWPNGKKQTIRQLAANKTIRLNQQDAREDARFDTTVAVLPFTDVTHLKGIDFTHRETFFFDYSFQQLLPQKYSQLGPFITTGDINADGLEDFFVGGAYNQSGRFFVQQKNGSFRPKDLVTGEKEQEDLGCLLFDCDGDHDLDLIVNSGGYEFNAGSPNYLPRLYLNDGKGNFRHERDAIPATISTSAQNVSGADIDGDGDTDLFIGGRISPNQFPVSPRSYILQNNHGIFTDVTESVCPALVQPGMITASVWTDLNQDKQPDLVITGEWMQPMFFQNDHGMLKEITASTGLTNMSGQWRSLAAADLDQDGDMDLVSGNLGLNNKFHASASEPIQLFAKDLDGNGSVDPVIAYYMPGPGGERKLYPMIGRDQLAAQVPSIKKKYLQYADFSKDDAGKILGLEQQEGITRLQCAETRSGWIENKGAGRFVFHPVPVMAQLSPVNAVLCTDADGDGNLDLLLAGNEYQAEVSIGRYDASYGLMLKGNGKGGFVAVPPATSGFILDGDVKDLRILTSAAHEKIVLAGVNDAAVKALKIMEH